MLGLTPQIMSPDYMDLDLRKKESKVRLKVINNKAG